jgi:hypothetical protein
VRPHGVRACLAATVFVLSAALAPTCALAQGVGINATGAAADTSALLDLNSTAKGLLLPRMTAAQRGVIALPATGLVIFQTDGASGLYWNAGVPAAPVWKQVADVAAAAGGQWSVSGANLYFSTGNVGVGTNAFAARFTVVDSLNALRVQTNYAGGSLASFGGFGSIRVDAPGVAGGRLSLLENGYLGLGRATPATRLDVLGGNWDVAGGEGDFRVGDPTYRLKMGVATSGAGAGSATIMQQGALAGYNVLALGAQGNKVLYVNGNSQRLGIGTDVPNAPLGFTASLGKKITLYPGATGDVGLGVAGNRLQLYGDSPAADVAMGYDQAGVFTERFAVKPTGALAVNGNTGAAGQVLQSNGAAAATWVSPPGLTFNNVYQVTSPNFATATAGGPPVDVPGLSQSFTVPGNARVIVSAMIPFNFHACPLCPMAGVEFQFLLDGASSQIYSTRAQNGFGETFTATFMVEVGPGTHNILVRGSNSSSYDVNFGSYTLPTETALMTLQVVPQ